MSDPLFFRPASGLTLREIAELTGVPEGTVKSRINRGRLELARVLKRMEI